MKRNDSKEIGSHNYYYNENHLVVDGSWKGGPYKCRRNY